MEDVRLTRVDAFNALIRGFVVLAFTAAICYGFVVSKVLSTETMVVLANTVFIWWFKSRDDEKKATTKPTNGASAPAAPGA